MEAPFCWLKPPIDLISTIQAAGVATYCPGRMAEHSKSKSTGVRFNKSNERFPADERKGNDTKLEESHVYAKSASMVS